MAVFERSELEASPLSDLHAIADQIGLDGFRRLRKAELINAILGEEADSREDPQAAQDSGTEDAPTVATRKRRAPRLRRGAKTAIDTEGGDAASDRTDEESEPEKAATTRPRRTRTRSSSGESSREESVDAERPRGRSPRDGGARSEGSSRRGGGRSQSDGAQEDKDSEGAGRSAAGVVEVLANGSAFLRVNPPEPSDDDVYISAAQVRRCELVSGDRVSGPVRTPRRSERYPSLVRVDVINGASSDAVSEVTRYEDMPVSWPSERLAFDSKDKTLEAIEWLTPLGKGSRATIIGRRGAGKSYILRLIYEALSERKELEVTVVLTGARPEEIAQWQDGEQAPAVALSFAASADAQGQALERALDGARRVAARGGDVVVLVDGLDGVSRSGALKALAAARNLREGGSLTVIATASQPLGGETTIIALDAELASAGRQPTLDLASSGTLQAGMLVGEDGAEAIIKARAAALESTG